MSNLYPVASYVVNMLIFAINCLALCGLCCRDNHPIRFTLFSTAFSFTVRITWDIRIFKSGRDVERRYLKQCLHLRCKRKPLACSNAMEKFTKDN